MINAIHPSSKDEGFLAMEDKKIMATTYDFGLVLSEVGYLQLRTNISDLVELDSVLESADIKKTKNGDRLYIWQGMDECEKIYTLRYNLPYKEGTFINNIDEKDFLSIFLYTGIKTESNFVEWQDESIRGQYWNNKFNFRLSYNLGFNDES